MYKLTVLSSTCIRKDLTNFCTAAMINKRNQAITNQLNRFFTP